MKIKRLTVNGLEEVEGRIYKGLGIYKSNDFNMYYCVLLNGMNKGIALCSCTKLKLIKEYIDKALNVITVEEIENNLVNDKISKDLVRLRNEYWVL